MIYDLFVKDAKWKALSKAHSAAMVYEERKRLSDLIFEREREIRAQAHVDFRDLCAGYGKGAI